MSACLMQQLLVLESGWTQILTLKRAVGSGRCTHCMAGVEVLAGPHMILLVGSIEGKRIPLHAAPFFIHTHNLVAFQHDIKFYIHQINCNATTPSHIDPNTASLILQTPSSMAF